MDGRPADSKRSADRLHPAHFGVTYHSGECRPDVRRDLSEFFERLVPESTPWFRHTTEGSDDMPSHIRSALTSTTLSIPVRGGQPGLGTWQAIYIFEHRAEQQIRHILLHLIGD